MISWSVINEVEGDANESNKRKDYGEASYRFVAYSRYFYFVTITFYHSIAVIILSERELWHLFLSKVIHRKPQSCLWLFVGFLVVATLITELQ